jgi:hypothetical protein
MPAPVRKIDKLLATNLKKAKMARAEKPYFYALVLKGGTSGKLLVDRLKIKMGAIQAAKKATGGSAVIIGVCYFDKQLKKLVFETVKRPVPTWNLLVKKLARDEAGLAIEVKFELAKRDLVAIKEPEAGDTDEEEGEWDEAEPDEGVAEQNAALEKWNLEFDALKSKLAEAAKAGKPWAKELWLKQSQAGTIYRQGKQAEAQNMLMEVELLFKEKQSASQPSGASGPQSPSAKPQAGSAPPTRPASSAPSTRPAGAAAAPVSLEGLHQSWEAALKKVRSHETKLVKVMVERFEGHPGLPEAKRAAQRVTDALKPFDQQLSNVLDQVVKAENPNDRGVWQKRASALVGTYLTSLDKDPVIAMLDSNPFMPVAIHKTLSTALTWLASKLS